MINSFNKPAHGQEPSYSVRSHERSRKNRSGGQRPQRPSPHDQIRRGAPPSFRGQGASPRSESHPKRPMHDSPSSFSRTPNKQGPSPFPRTQSKHGNRRHQYRHKSQERHAGIGLSDDARSAHAPRPMQVPPITTGALRFVPLGGCGEVGRSMYVYEYGDDIVIVDMGLQFPEEDMPGIDYLIPNVEYLKSKKDNIRGIIITHGHYDHIGAIPHLLDQLGNPPIYATALTRGIILKRQDDFKGYAKPNIEVITTESIIPMGSFKIEFFHVNHNIPDCVGIVLKTPAGTAIHTGDFKFDHTPVNEPPADIERLTKLGNEGVLLLVSESTDAEYPGHQISESDVQKSLEEIFKEVKGRVITATFASLLTRVQQLIWLSEKYNRKVLIEGFSMKSNVAVAQELGYLKVKKGTLIEQKQLNDYPDDQITVVCTGAQGEDRAVLMRIANNEHRVIHLKPTDSIVFSSSVIPGNEQTVQRLKDILFKRVSRVYHRSTMDIHAGGHAKHDELKQMIEMTKPRYLIPIHGNYFMLKLHTGIALETGMPQERTLIVEDGEFAEMTSGRIVKLKEKAPMDLIMVDGLGVGDVKEVVLRDRQHLAEDGIFVIITLVDSISGRVRTSPDIISRGFIYLRESQDLLKEVRHFSKKVVEDITIGGSHPVNWTYIKDELREKIGSFLFQKTQRRPMVLPVVIEV